MHTAESSIDDGGNCRHYRQQCPPHTLSPEAAQSLAETAAAAMVVSPKVTKVRGYIEIEIEREKRSFNYLHLSTHTHTPV